MARNSINRKHYRSTPFRFHIQHFGANREQRRAAGRRGEHIPAQNTPLQKDRDAPQLAKDADS